MSLPLAGGDKIQGEKNMQKYNWKIEVVNEWTGEKRSLKYNGTVDEAKDFLLKLAEEDGCKYGGEGSWFLPYDRSDVREGVKWNGKSCVLSSLYAYNGLLNGDITYEAILISDIS